MRIRFQDERVWHAWFAWRPVFVRNDLVWLERIERRIQFGYCGADRYYRFSTEDAGQ